MDTNGDANEGINLKVNEDANEDINLKVTEDADEGISLKVMEDANEDINLKVNEDANEDINLKVNEHVDILKEDLNPAVKNLKRTYAAMNGFIEITLSNGLKKAQCVHCEEKFVVEPGDDGGTTQFQRHVQQCEGCEETTKKRLIMSYKTCRIKNDNVRILKNFNFDQEKVREAAAGMVIGNECLFEMFKSKVFNLFVNSFNPEFERILPRIAKGDCLRIYEDEKEGLKELLETVDKLSLTAELWHVGNKTVYVCLTGHFFDSEKKLQRRILSLCDVPSPRSGLAISDAIFKCLLDWGIENKVSSITVDCSSASGVALDHLKHRIGSNGKLLFGGKVFHQRCCVHIIDLMAQNGLNEIHDFVDNIRKSVRYLRLSKKCLLKFTEIVKQLHMPSKKLILDDSACWNATYSMLVAAMEFREVFPRYQGGDPDYTWLPTSEDWERGEQVCQILKVLVDVKKDFLRSENLTAMVLMKGIWKIREILSKKSMAENPYLRAVVLKIKGIFDKFWGELPLLIALATVLDPRLNMNFLEFWFRENYPEFEAERKITYVRDALYELFNGYVVSQGSSNSGQGMHGDGPKGCSSSVCVDTEDDLFELYMEQRAAGSDKSELDMYLEEGPCHRALGSGCSVLEWWKARSYGYPILSKMASDILSIPFGATSRSSLGTLHRIVDHYHASMSKEMVQALSCAADWLNCSNGIKSSPDVSIFFFDIKN